MTPAAVLSVVVRANTAQANSALTRTHGLMKGMAVQSGFFGERVARGMKLMTLATVGFAAGAGVMAIDFDKAMRNVNSLAKLPEPAFQRLKESILSLAGPTAQAPTTLAQGMYELVSSGFDAREALHIVEKSAIAASAGLTTTEISTKAVAGVLNAYRLPARKAGQVSDELFQTVNLGVLTFEELSQTIGDVLPFSSALGVNMKGVGAAVSTMTRAGLPAPETMTRIKNVMVALIKPSENLEAAYKKLGVAGGEELIKKFGGGRIGFQKGLEALVKTTDGTKGAMAELFPNIRALGGALALTGANTRRANQDLAAFRDTSGATAEVFEEQQKSAALKIQQAWSEIQANMIRMGEVFAPIMADLVAGLSTIVRVFESLPGPMKTAIVVIGLLAYPLFKITALILTAAAAWRAYTGATVAAGTATQVAAGQMTLFGGAGAAGAGSKVAGLAGTLMTRVVPAIAAVGIGFELASQKAATHSDDIMTKLDALGSEAEAFGLKSGGFISDIMGVGVESARDLEEILEMVSQSKIVTPEQLSRIQGLIDALDLSEEEAGKVWTVIGEAQKGGELLQKLVAGGIGPLQQYGSEAVRILQKVAKEANKQQLADKLMPPTLQEQVGRGLKAINSMFQNQLGKLGGLTRKQMLKIGIAMQEGPERGREMMVKVFDKMIRNIDKKLAAGKISVSKWSDSIGRIIKQQLLIFGADSLSSEAKHALTMIGAAQGNLSGRQRGGIATVPGYGDGDKVHILAEPGEGFLNKTAMQAIGGEKGLNTINSMFPRFQKGGKIPSFKGTSPGTTDNIEAAGLNLVAEAARRFLKQQGGAGANWKSIDALAARLGLARGTLTGRLGQEGSRHGIRGPGGRALATDYSGPIFGSTRGPMAEFTRKLIPLALKAKLNELFYDPLGGWDQGRAIGAIGGHDDHVHVSLQKGGIVKDFARAGVDTKASKRAMFALYMAGLAESGMKDLHRGDGTSEGTLQLLASTAAAYNINPHNEYAVAKGFLTHGYWGKGGAIRLSDRYKAAMVAHLVQGNATGTGVYSAQASGARKLLEQSGLKFPKNIATWEKGAEAGKEKAKIKPKLLRKINKLKLPRRASKRIKDLTHSADIFEEYANRAEQLEDKVFGKTQVEWLQKELVALFRLRNALIQAEAIVVAKRKKATKMLAKVKNPKAKAKIRDMREGLNTQRGDLLSALQDVQGIGSPMNAMRRLPDVGVLGGRVFDVQMRLKQLGEDVNASDDSKGLTSAQLREIGFLKTLGLSFLPEQFAGIFDAGGRIPQGKFGLSMVPELIEGPAIVHSPEKTADMFGRVSEPIVEVHNHFEDGAEWMRDFVRTEIKVKEKEDRSHWRAGRRTR